MSGMKVLPRYRPTQSKVGCAEHGDLTCLCDVVIGTPVPIIRTEHKFHTIALNELGDDTVSDRNLYEFFSIVLGLHELETHISTIDRAITRWPELPRNVATALHHHAKADSEWAIARIELEDVGLPPAQIKKLGHEYVQMAAKIRARKRTGRPPSKNKLSDAELLERKRKRDRDKKAAKRADPEVRAQRNAARRAARLGKSGKSWLEAKRTGPTLVPGTYELTK